MMTSSFVTNRIKLPLMLGYVGITLLSGCVQMQMPDPTLDNKNIQRKDKPVFFPPSPPPPTSCYRVKSGDTLFRVAVNHGHTYQQLAEWNGLQPSRWDGQKPVYDLHPGQLLRVTSVNVTCY